MYQLGRALAVVFFGLVIGILVWVGLLIADHHSDDAGAKPVQVIEGCHWNKSAIAWQYPDSSLCRGTGEDPTVDQYDDPVCANRNPAVPQQRFGTLTFSCVGGKS
jgi:hypothetical protein